MASAVYPGTFDPVHNGHVDVARRAAPLFDRLTIAVYETTPPKGLLLNADRRVALFAESVSDLPNVDVVSFSGLVTAFAREVGARFIVRGLRAGVDFEAEFEMAHMWRNLDPEIDVVCLISALQYLFVHSSRIREVAELGGDVTGLVPRGVAKELKARFDLVS